MDKVIFVPCIENRITYEFLCCWLTDSQKAETYAGAISNSDGAVWMRSQVENTAFTVLLLGPTLIVRSFFSFSQGSSEAAYLSLSFIG